MWLKGHAGSLYTLDARKPYYISALPLRLRVVGGLLEYSLQSGMKTLPTVYSYYRLSQPIVQKLGQSHHCLLAIEKLPS
jgi:hypothetical protein